MYLILRDSNSQVFEALVLDHRSDRLRVAIPGDDDARELIRFGSDWFYETGERVQFEFMAAGEAQGPFSVPAHLLSRVAS